MAVMAVMVAMVAGAVMATGVHGAMGAAAVRPMVAPMMMRVAVAMLTMMPVMLAVMPAVLPVRTIAVLGQEGHDAHPGLNGRLEGGAWPGIGRSPRREGEGGREGDEAGQEPWDPGQGEHWNSSRAVKETRLGRGKHTPLTGKGLQADNGPTL